MFTTILALLLGLVVGLVVGVVYVCRRLKREDQTTADVVAQVWPIWRPGKPQ